MIEGRHFYYKLMLFSLALSIFLLLINVYNFPVINPDGVVYLQTAKALTTQGWHAAIQIYPWPFFPFLIALTSKIMGNTFLQAAYYLNGIFFFFTIMGFVSLIRKMRLSPAVQLLSVLVLAFFHSYNGFLHQIVRDNGYWCMMIWAANFLILFIESPKLLFALLWNIFTLLAVLFRIEAGLFLLFVPICIFFCRDFSVTQRLVYFFKLYCLTLLVLVALSAHLILAQHHLGHDSKFMQLFFLIKDGPSVLYTGFAHINQLMVQSVLPDITRSLSFDILLGGLVFTFFVVFINTFSWANLLALGYFLLHEKIRWRNHINKVFITYLIISFILMFAYTIHTFYFVGRYDVLFCLLLLPYSIQGLILLWVNWRHKQKKWILSNCLFPLVCVLYLVAIIGSLHNFGTSKQYVADAAAWIKKNVPNNVTIYTNNDVLGYLSDHQWTGGWCGDYLGNANCFSWESATNTPWQGQAYVILDIKATENNLYKINELIKNPPIKIFKTNKKDIILIYQNV